MMIVGFASAAKPIISILLTPTSGIAGSEYNAAITNNAQVTIQKITFQFGSKEIIPISTDTCRYSSGGITLKSMEEAKCTFRVPQMETGEYTIRVVTGPVVSQAPELFKITNPTPNYEGILSKVKVGTVIPDTYGAVIGDGKYQGYALKSPKQISKCTRSEIESNQINYEAIITVESGKITSVTKGETTDSLMEVCLSDKAIKEIEKSTDPLTTIADQLESGEMSYSISDAIQKMKFTFLQFIASILGGDYAKIGKILSFAK